MVASRNPIMLFVLVRRCAFAGKTSASPCVGTTPPLQLSRRFQFELEACPPFQVRVAATVEWTKRVRTSATRLRAKRCPVRPVCAELRLRWIVIVCSLVICCLFTCVLLAADGQSPRLSRPLYTNKHFPADVIQSSRTLADVQGNASNNSFRAADIAMRTSGMLTTD